VKVIHGYRIPATAYRPYYAHPFFCLCSIHFDAWFFMRPMRVVLHGKFQDQDNKGYLAPVKCDICFFHLISGALLKGRDWTGMKLQDLIFIPALTMVKISGLSAGYYAAVKKMSAFFYTGGGCKIYESRPLICRCYPFLMGELVIDIMHCEEGKSRIDARSAKQIALLVKRYELKKLRSYISIFSQLGDKLRLADLHPLPKGYDGELIVCDGERSIPVKVSIRVGKVRIQYPTQKS